MFVGQAAAAMAAFTLAAAPVAAPPMITAPVAVAGAVPRPDVRVQWWMDSWAVERLVWPLTRGRGVTVAVIDTGVNAALPDLRGALLPGKNIETGTGPVRRDIDDDPFGHGTTMITLIASRGHRTGFVGIAPEAKALPIIATTGETVLAPAIRYAADQGAKVINISLGSAIVGRECPPAVQQAIRYATLDKDVVIVAAAGNSGDDLNPAEYPASCPGVVAVGAFDNQAVPWAKTQRHRYVTVAAPGVRIPALAQDGRVWPNGEGTSNAAALASGAFALIRSRFPAMSAREAVRLVTNTTVDIGPRGRDDASGFGAISLRRALRQSVPPHAPNPVFERLDQVIVATARPAEPQRRARKATGTAPSAAVWLVGLAVALAIGILAAVLVWRRTGPPPPPPYRGQGAPPPIWPTPPSDMRRPPPSVPPGS